MALIPPLDGEKNAAWKERNGFELPDKAFLPARRLIGHACKATSDHRRLDMRDGGGSRLKCARFPAFVYPPNRC
jgi:hypothetical protein